MRKRIGILFSFVVLLSFLSNSQTLKYEFIKNCLIYSETEVITDLTARNFNFVAKDYANMGDALINHSDYYTNKKEGSNDTAEIAVFINKRKSSKKSVMFSFTETQAFANFNALEQKIESGLTNLGSFHSERFSTDVKRFTYDEKYYYYLFKDEFIWYIITSNFKLEDYYFTIRSK